MERGITRILHCTASPSEFLQIMQSFNALVADLGVQVWETQDTPPEAAGAETKLTPCPFSSNK